MPLSLLGPTIVLEGLKIDNNLYVQIGLILLMGLVTKNAILVVDFANVQRREGVGRSEALIAAAKRRSYPSRAIAGRSTEDTALASATAEPGTSPTPTGSPRRAPAWRRACRPATISR